MKLYLQGNQVKRYMIKITKSDYKVKKKYLYFLEQYKTKIVQYKIQT